MYSLLTGLRIVECASFVAAPSCGLHLLQMGAEVIRIDDVRRSLDRTRWPLAPNGESLYWEGLNKGKKSVALDLSSAKGRELATALITAGGDGAGLFLTNFPNDGFLAHERLAQIRRDLVTVRVAGWSDGRSAVDYTVNAAVGIPMMTGPTSLGDAPVNHVLPAWDLITGAYAGMALLAAERHRRITGQGQEVNIPLGDVAIAALANLGQVAEVLVAGNDRPRLGNDLFGATGRDFITNDRQRIMIVAITARQWKALVESLRIEDEIAKLESRLGVSFQDEGVRFIYRDEIAAIISRAVVLRTYAEISAAFDAVGVCWAPYRTLHNAIKEGALTQSPGLFSTVTHPSGVTYPTPGSAARFGALPRQAAPRAPRLGEHTESVLASALGMEATAIKQLSADGVIYVAADTSAS